ncbi:carbonic anhydrase family protein [Mucisphaera calidilacus]|uniref:Carbonic anhydrase 2 n=1 Tax=Mucisphaera calidilacus TaxID=2527982 RepID=A0A518BUQ9_9BACT|nr:carbonic anhydrase family protein [Mucisphaera calidilacus]QDU70691.1 Carbonic anhydrase 2 [Mucisphaera calidilacus]
MLARFAIALALCTTLITGCGKYSKLHQADSTVMTKPAQADMTPAQAYQDLKAGNQRFAAGSDTKYDYLAQARTTASEGQYPKAVILSCLDSRVPVEAVFDQGIGDVFVGRVAGNVEDVAMIGSFEFATELAGTPLIVVLGHTSCGAVKGAIADARLGNLTALLAEISPAIDATPAQGMRDVANTQFVNAVVETNVRQTINDLTARSSVLETRVASGELMIVGGVYDLATGKVAWLQ